MNLRSNPNVMVCSTCVLLKETRATWTQYISQRYSVGRNEEKSYYQLNCMYHR